MIDELFNYATPHNLQDLLCQSVKLQGNARCRLRINGNTAIATELPDNPGMSLTNAAAAVAMQVCQFHEIPVSELIWIEHYPDEPGQHESFDLVHFGSDNGLLKLERWERISKDKAERLFKEPLD
ncbi:MAG: hypothetical protein DCF25_11835 [Leptolyngbya foveolarum]|uniref:Uncharacterized protein n=1 Tax=Leptolyngbya foveolarum TaxID=47253 RepID=A0A2W4WCH9_9CYAN|nr:MAG: hypothetical protein DCF25_11835 [Leptolyngbya foveolarum]